MAIDIYSAEARALIDRAVRQVLADPSRPFNRASVIGTGAFYIAKTDGSGLTARVGTTPGTGTCTLQTIDANTAFFVAQTDDDDADVTVTAYNLSTQTLPADSYTVLVQDQLTGRYWAVWEDCP